MDQKVATRCEREVLALVRPGRPRRIHERRDGDLFPIVGASSPSLPPRIFQSPEQRRNVLWVNDDERLFLRRFPVRILADRDGTDLVDEDF
jgi:hypothetical protein